MNETPLAVYQPHDIHKIPTTRGSYLLLFHLQQSLSALPIGRLGTLHLPGGSWIYCGSAWGPGGLRGRLQRHLRAEKKPHWHIDFLSNHVVPVALIVALQPEPVARLECVWAQQILNRPGVTTPIKGFGSSDCRAGCPTHLLHVSTPISAQTLQSWLST